MAGDIASSGPRFAPAPPLVMECFEVRGCWQRQKKKSECGPNEGVNWVADAARVQYTAENIVAAQSPTFYKAQGQIERIWWTVHDMSEENVWGGKKPQWQQVLAPRWEASQWVWCIFDYAANVWRVLDAVEDIVRAQLVDNLYACCTAKAIVYGCVCGQSGQNYKPCCPRGSGSGSGSGSGGCAGCNYKKIESRGEIIVCDMINTVSASPLKKRKNNKSPYYVAKGTCLYSKRFADCRQWEVLSFGGALGGEPKPPKKPPSKDPPPKKPPKKPPKHRNGSGGSGYVPPNVGAAYAEDWWRAIDGTWYYHQGKGNWYINKDGKWRYSENDGNWWIGINGSTYWSPEGALPTYWDPNTMFYFDRPTA
jgi:hypothetical protein